MGVKIIPISDLRRQASRVMKELREGSDVMYITQHGRPVAVLVEYEQYETLLSQLEDLADLDSLEKADGEPEQDYEAFLAEMNAEIDNQND